jgi:hypothetical protein
MRKVSVNDKGMFCLNNKPYFQSLVLNQVRAEQEVTGEAG